MQQPPGSRRKVNALLTDQQNNKNTVQYTVDFRCTKGTNCQNISTEHGRYAIDLHCWTLRTSGTTAQRAHGGKLRVGENGSPVSWSRTATSWITVQIPTPVTPRAASRAKCGAVPPRLGTPEKNPVNQRWNLSQFFLYENFVLKGFCRES